MIRPEILELLRCPESHQKLTLAPDERIAALNSKIERREVQNRTGKAVEQPLQGGLLREDGSMLYPIRGNLPIMLVDEAIPTAVGARSP